jgi:hypothetical protein
VTLGVTLECEPELRGGGDQADRRTVLAGRAELAGHVAKASSDGVAPVTELVDNGDADRDEQRGQNQQEECDREQHDFLAFSAKRIVGLCLVELVAEFLRRNLRAKPQLNDVSTTPTFDGALSSEDKPSQ